MVDWIEKLITLFTTKQVELNSNEKYCENCNGWRYTMCHCGDEICPVCDGLGKFPNQKINKN